MPSPFLVADCCQSGVLSGDPRVGADRSAPRGRCNTTRDQVALANSLCPRTRSLDRACLYPLSYEARRPCEERRSRSPFIGVGGASERRSVAGMEAVERHGVRCPFGYATSRRCGSERVEAAVSPGLSSPGHPIVASPDSHDVGTRRTRYGRPSSTRSAWFRSPLRGAVASVTRPAKDEILVMERRVPSVRLE